MKNIILLLLWVCWTQSIFAQDDILRQIEENNTLLSSLRSQSEAEKIANKTGIYLENPEVGYGYLWGNEQEIGNRIDFSVSQSFDFPTSYIRRKRLMDKQNSQVDLKYKIERKDILLEAKKLYIQLIYQNALSIELKKQMDLSGQVADAYLKKYKVGEVSVLDLNKTKYDLLNAQKEYKASLVEKDFLLAELTRLNGGKRINFSEDHFSQIILPDNFEIWYSDQKLKNYSLVYAQKEISLSKTNEKLQRSLNLPKFSAGYMSEKVSREHFQGITIGVSIPLWENKNTVRQIKAQTLAFEQIEQDISLQSYHEQEALYKKAANQKQILDEFNEFELTDHTVILLQKALDKGEISLINYILELGIYYDLIKSRLETERDLHLIVADLFQWEL